MSMHSLGFAPERPLAIVWYKRDLRVLDHAPLVHAVTSEASVLPLYIVEPSLWQGDDMAPRHWHFIHQSLCELRQQLAELGQPLVVRTGEVVEILDSLRRMSGAIRLYSHQETGNDLTFRRDRAVHAWATTFGVEWKEFRQHGIQRPLRSREGWSRQWDRQMAEPLRVPPMTLAPLPGIDPGDIPEVPRPDWRGTYPRSDLQTGGERAAQSLLNSFLGGRGVRYHREMSSPVTAARSCSRLSTHLAYGTISLRYVAQATLQAMQQARLEKSRPGSDGMPLTALRAFLGRLHWHCHFMQKLEDQPSIEFHNFMRSYDGLREDHFSEEFFEAWATGRTGYPMVDACMRCLQATGWINFRMRAMLMSFAAQDLWLHWRRPALHLARLFLDYEPGIHYSQVQMQSGTTGINTLRIYNPVKQSRDHDPEGIFLRAWLPELAHLPNEWIHEPWLMPVHLQREVQFASGKDYPWPIVDHALALRTARQRWSLFRGTEAARMERKELSRRHGSRKRPRERKPVPPKVAEIQTTLFEDA